MKTSLQKQTKTPLLGEHRLAVNPLTAPPEREDIARLQRQSPVYTAFAAVDEARDLGLMRPRIRQVELSPTLGCPEDCGGCPDRASLHLQAPREQQLPIEDWFEITEQMVTGYGAEYFLLIGGTIDRHPHTPKLMRHILDMPEPVDAGWFTDGIMLLDARNGQLTPTWEKLCAQGKLLEITTHISADYLVPQGTRSEGPVLDPENRWQTQSGGSRYYKSAFGLRLARLLVEKGAKRVIVNTTIQAHDLSACC